jgi:hypothetical protein
MLARMVQILRVINYGPNLADLIRYLICVSVFYRTENLNKYILVTILFRRIPSQAMFLPFILIVEGLAIGIISPD